MQFDVITLFPEMFSALDCGIVGRAKKNGLIALRLWNPRDFAKGKYRKVDDSPYGGGPGMVMMFEPLQAAIYAARQVDNESPTVIYLTPQGKTLNSGLIDDFISKKRLILIAGRYEGVDERIVDLEVDLEVSIGDCVLSGGELAAMIIVDTITRQLPGVLGDPESSVKDSFVDNLLDYPHYTRPEFVSGCGVPKVLLSGDHVAISKWRRKQALGKTWAKRPDLLAKSKLTESDTLLLNEFIEENKKIEAGDL